MECKCSESDVRKNRSSNKIRLPLYFAKSQPKITALSLSLFLPIPQQAIEIQTIFDWKQADFYRYMPATLDGTRAGTDFFPPSKQSGVGIRPIIFKAA